MEDKSVHTEPEPEILFGVMPSEHAFATAFMREDQTAKNDNGDVVYTQFADDSDVQHCVRDGRLTERSTEEERYELLKNVKVKLAEVNHSKIERPQTNFGGMRTTESVKP